jgi:hypothetical protein
MAAEGFLKGELEGRRFYFAQGKDPVVYTEIAFLAPEGKLPPPLQGVVRYIRLTREDEGEGSVEWVHYWIEKGKLYITGNDASLARYTLLRRGSESWVLEEEEDPDISDGRKAFRRKGQMTWFPHRPASFLPVDRCRVLPGDFMSCRVAGGRVTTK